MAFLLRSPADRRGGATIIEDRARTVCSTESTRGGPVTSRQTWRIMTAQRYLEGSMSAANKPRLVGFNHVALEVGDIDEALAFYGRLFDFELRGKSADMAFIDLGDQFLALQRSEERRVGKECRSR